MSRLALGTMNFGPVTDERTSFTIMDLAVESGINVLDSADVYGMGARRARPRVAPASAGGTAPEAYAW